MVTETNIFNNLKISLNTTRPDHNNLDEKEETFLLVYQILATEKQNEKKNRTE